MSERHCFPVIVHLLIVSGARLLLLRRSGTGLYDGCWAPPGGHVEAGETPVAAVLRETREEVGFEIDVGQVRPVGLVHFSNGGGGFNLLFAAALREPLQPIFDRRSADAADWWPRLALPAARVPWLDMALELADLADGQAAGSGAFWYVEGH